MSTATADPAAAPASPTGGAPTLVSQTQPTGYQPTTAQPQPAVDKPAAATVETPAKDQPVVETPADPAAAKPAVDPAKPDDPEFKLPDEYKDKAWASKIKSADDLYKQLDNLTAAVGKKTVVPNLKEATPEAREEFYAQLRGKEASEYPIPENKAFPTPAETQPVVAKLFMDNGVSPVQAEAIIKGYQDLGAKQLAEQFNPDGFKKSMETAFGADWEKTTGAVRNTISTMMNADDQKALDNIPNNILGVVYRAMGNTINAVNETLKKYGAKETFAHLQAPNGKVNATDLGSARQVLRQQLDALSMRPHTAQEQQAIIDQLNDTYKNDPRLTQQG